MPRSAGDTVICERIDGGFHVHDDAVRIAVHAAGVDRTAFITDATPAAGMTDGQFVSGALLHPERRPTDHGPDPRTTPASILWRGRD